MWNWKLWRLDAMGRMVTMSFYSTKLSRSCLRYTKIPIARKSTMFWSPGKRDWDSQNRQQCNLQYMMITYWYYWLTIFIKLLKNFCVKTDHEVCPCHAPQIGKSNEIDSLLNLFYQTYDTSHIICSYYMIHRIRYILRREFNASSQWNNASKRLIIKKICESNINRYHSW